VKVIFVLTIMKTNHLLSICALLIGWGTHLNLAAPLGSAFTYQGQLQQAGSPAQGTFDLKFTLFDSLDGGTAIGGTVTTNGLAVSDGLFVVTLDFGGNAFTGEARWLEISVKTNGAVDYVSLVPRQPLSPSPYALHAQMASSVPDHTITSTQIGSAQVVKSLNGLKDEVQLSAGDNIALSTLGNVVNIAATVTTGPKGDTGAKGDTGLTGPPGPQGPSTTTANTLYIGADQDANEDGSSVSIGTDNLPWMTINKSGWVGIGTVLPDNKLHIANWDSDYAAAMRITSASAGLGSGLFLENTYGGKSNLWAIYNHAATTNLVIGDNKIIGSGVLVLTRGGKVGIGMNNPVGKLHIESNANNEPAIMLSSASLGWGSGLKLENRYNNVTNGWGIYTYGPDGTLVLASDQYADHALYVHTNGTTSVKALEIRGGADIAEPFQVTERQEIRPGQVVCIDSAQTGTLCLSAKAYDPTVAGIVSGANGINSGMILRQENTVADGTHPVALTGRVWCYCDADAGGSIEPGDLLTTADTPGHAMKAVDREKAFGAILGKAMSSLDCGKGLVLVLVSLQ
jgi:hypothetical protein